MMYIQCILDVGYAFIELFINQLKLPQDLYELHLSLFMYAHIYDTFLI